MDILFLLSEEERDIFPKGLLIQDIVLRTDKNILESVLAKNPKHIFITRSYVDTHGEDIILKTKRKSYIFAADVFKAMSTTTVPCKSIRTPPVFS